MNLYTYDAMLVVAENKEKAIERMKEKYPYINLGHLTTWEVEEINKVDGYKINLIK